MIKKMQVKGRFQGREIHLDQHWNLCEQKEIFLNPRKIHLTMVVFSLCCLSVFNQLHSLSSSTFLGFNSFDSSFHFFPFSHAFSHKKFPHEKGTSDQDQFYSARRISANNCFHKRNKIAMYVSLLGLP